MPTKLQALKVIWDWGAAPAAGQIMFYAYYDRIAPAANKYMATLFNTSATRKVSIIRIWQLWNPITAVVGVVHDSYIARITARTAGTSVTIRARDSNDTLSAGITADTNSTVVTESFISKRFIGSSEESPVTVTSVNTYGDRQANLLYEFTGRTGEKAETLRANQGISIRTLTASTVGVMSYCIEFVDEAA